MFEFFSYAMQEIVESVHGSWERALLMLYVALCVYVLGDLTSGRVQIDRWDSPLSVGADQLASALF